MDLLWQHVEYWARIKPSAEAMVFEGQRLSWKEFDEQINRTAKAFLALGVQPGDRVALISMARPEFMVSYLAASKIGAIWLGLSPKFALDELRNLLGHSRPKLLIVLREYMGIDLVQTGLTFFQEFSFLCDVLVINKIGKEGIDYGSFTSEARPELDQALAVRAAQVRPGDETLLIYTSGSTGKPKGVLHTHEAIIRNIAQEVKHFEWSEESRVLLHFPINHVAASVEIGFGAVCAGAALIMMDRFDPVESLQVMERERVTVLGQVPAMYLLQFQQGCFRGTDFSRVRAFIYGGSTPPQALVDILSGVAQRTGARLMTGYGSTELCGFVTYSTPEDDLELLTKSAGKVAPGFEMKVVDEDRKPLSAGQIGEIAVRGPSIMKGYLNSPEATAEVVDADGWYYTSDLGYLNARGYLFISGRKSEMYKSGGENVFPREVEEVLESHSAVLFAAVIGVPDPVYSEVGTAFVMPKPGQQLTVEELQRHCRAHLVNFKVPKHFELRPMLPLLPSGKVNKLALKNDLGLR